MISNSFIREEYRQKKKVANPSACVAQKNCRIIMQIIRNKNASQSNRATTLIVKKARRKCSLPTTQIRKLFLVKGFDVWFLTNVVCLRSIDSRALSVKSKLKSSCNI